MSSVAGRLLRPGVLGVPPPIEHGTFAWVAAAVSDRKPFTKRERQRMTDTGFGHRSTNNWNSGDLPAPWAEGDVVELVGEPARLHGMTSRYYVVVYSTSIDRGDAWYFRVWDGLADRRSDRLHVVFSERSEWDHDVDWMAPFRLVETADPEGLALRQRMIADGWQTADVLCEACGGRGRIER